MGHSASSLNTSHIYAKYQEIIKCKNCSARFRSDEEVFICKIGHAICRSCKNQLDICTECKSEINETRCFALEEIIKLMESAYHDDKQIKKELVKSNTLSKLNLGHTSQVPQKHEEYSFWRKCEIYRIAQNGFSTGKEAIYIGRVYHKGALIPGKICLKSRKCFVASAGQEYSSDDFQLLYDLPGSWIKSSGDDIPLNALPGGIGEDGEVLYIGRMRSMETVQIGFVQPSKGVFYVAEDEKVIIHKSFELLVVPGSIDLSIEYMSAKRIQLFYEKSLNTSQGLPTFQAITGTQHLTQNLDPFWYVYKHGELPSNAIIGGSSPEKELYYIGRTFCEGALLPGQIDFKRRKCTVAKSGKVYTNSYFAVLHNISGAWVPCTGHKIPSHAFPAGVSEHGEVLLIGRVHCKDSLQIGSVQPSVGACNITCDDLVISYSQFEVFVAAEGIDVSRELMKAKQIQSFFKAYPITSPIVCEKLWVKCYRSVPPNAFKAAENYNGKPIFIGRAEHNSCMIPGKVSPIHNTCYISWNCVEFQKHEYEVLCDETVTWIKTSLAKIPAKALTAGNNLNGEPFYVGRVLHNNNFLIGRVQASRAACLAAYGGEELEFKEYDILVDLSVQT